MGGSRKNEVDWVVMVILVEDSEGMCLCHIREVVPVGVYSAFVSTKCTQHAYD